MNAIRADEELDNIHSLYVDQWDWEAVITRKDRTVAFLKDVVRRIYHAIRRTEYLVCESYRQVKPFLPSDIHFIHSEELLKMYPNLTPKDREDEIDKLHQVIDEGKKQLEEANEKNSYLSEKIASLEASLRAATNKLNAEGEGGYETILPDAKNDPPKVINIGDAAEKAAGDMAEAATKAGISIRTISTDATLMVKASPTMIDVLFKNIIDNAIKYMSREGTLQITISRIEQELFIVMKDNGEGLAQNETEHIFELNFQGTNRISGNGLGLAQARAIVEYYGGMIYARSSVGSGMGIYIHLPSAV